ncbi:hypothetical protein BU26DRAFT_578429 [Trematosphaeria pertusa]|uniref:Uncharacterized protein n=1 Tax=Trematosphaeria pertusa TaxID=390896 RepID=A0A6A6I545_9PLEO|nr:uncharacterized protein BU26DRAFT_578429 [Trematosphaeria pertusa]KAF2245645.1 hypothetical protein BU26DRAFT_578429 [Trematosphaeria pertusa]
MVVVGGSLDAVCVRDVGAGLSAHSFHYGCAAGSQESLVAAPVAFTITVKGGSNDGVTCQSIKYAAGALMTQMLKVTLSSRFSSVKRVDFDGSNSLVTAALIDTVGSVYSAQQIAK